MAPDLSRPERDGAEQDGNVRSWGRHTWEPSEAELAAEEKYGRPLRELLLDWRWRQGLGTYEIAELCGVRRATVEFWMFKHKARAKDLIAQQLATAAEAQP